MRLIFSLRPAILACFTVAGLVVAGAAGCGGPGDTPTGVPGTDEIDTSPEYEEGERAIQ